MINYVLGLGSNLSDPLIQLRKAVKIIKSHQNINIKSYSSIYLTNALVPDNAPQSWNLPYLNAAILIQTSLSPDSLLNTIKEIETNMGRAPDHEFWSPRAIDIDILCSDFMTIATDRLTIPHKELLNRSFALIPLLDVLPNWRHPRDIQLDLESYIQTLEPIKKVNQLLCGPEIMGILNITPDSFSDGNPDQSTEKIITRFNQMLLNGAHCIDIGAESTRKDAKPIDHKDEWKRLKPVLDTLKEIYINLDVKPKISIDTRHAKTMEKVIDYEFVRRINDVEGSDIHVKATILSSFPYLEYIMMDNWRGPLAKMTSNIENDFDRVTAFLEYQMDKLVSQGVKKEQLIFDPGFGFAKPSRTVKTLSNAIVKLKSILDLPVLIGHSRKQSVVNPLKQFDQSNINDQFDLETSILSFHFIALGVDILRVHQVQYSHRASVISSFYN